MAGVFEGVCVRRERKTILGGEGVSFSRNEEGKNKKRAREVGKKREGIKGKVGEMKGIRIY